MTSQVLIIGAGPYGVSIALELHRRGIPFIICGKLFSLWHQHTLTQASLRSDVHVSEVFTQDRRFKLDRYLDQSPFQSEARRISAGRVPVRVFREYLKHVESKLPFPVIDEHVVHVERDHTGHFIALTAQGRDIHAAQVVLACGIEAHRNLPHGLESLGEERVSHSWQVNQYEQATGQRVLVVGSGQSAAEAVSLLRKSNEVTWLHRTQPVYYADPIALPRPVFALAMRGAHVFSFMPQWLRHRLRKHLLGTTVTPDMKVELNSENVTRIEADVESLRLEIQGTVVRSASMGQCFDKVVACTGYRYRLKNLKMMAPSLREAIACESEIPLLDRRFMTSVAGLYIVGAMAELKHGPAMRFMSGTRTTAILIGSAIEARSVN